MVSPAACWVLFEIDIAGQSEPIETTTVFTQTPFQSYRTSRSVLLLIISDTLFWSNQTHSRSMSCFLPSFHNTTQAKILGVKQTNLQPRAGRLFQYGRAVLTGRQTDFEPWFCSKIRVQSHKSPFAILISDSIERSFFLTNISRKVLFQS